MTERGSTYKWRRIRQAARAADAANQNPCWLCGQRINYTITEGPNSWEPDHYWPVSIRPDLLLERANIRPSHSRCNRARGNTPPHQLAEHAIGLQSRAW